MLQRAVNRGSGGALVAMIAGLLAGCGSSGPGAHSPDGVDAATGDAASDATTGDAGVKTGDASSVDTGGGMRGEGGATGQDGASVMADSAVPTADAGVACKRGLATNTAPSTGFVPTPSSPGLTWWYNWSNQGTNVGTSIAFIPMIWGSGSLAAAIPTGSAFLLAFNEPNFKAQADLTPQEAAADWPMIQAKANGIPIVSPAVNFCGSASDSSQCSDPSVTDPYTYLQDFLADCPGCEVDYIAVHWYNCDLPSLEAYLEGNLDSGGTLQGFVQLGKPIWLTEFSCDTTHSVADQMAYMQAAIPYLESNPNVFRYSWFSASAIPNAQLMNADGSLTALGQTYVALPEACR
jgi:hypothetical protein